MAVVDGPLDDTREVLVPFGHLSVMGDNHADSRVPVAQGGVGLPPLWNLQGRVVLVLASRDVARPGSNLAAWLASIRPGRFLPRPGRRSSPDRGSDDRPSSGAETRNMTRDKSQEA